MLIKISGLLAFVNRYRPKFGVKLGRMRERRCGRAWRQPPAESGYDSAMTSPRWWHGKRGEWYVVVQFILLGLVLVAPWLAAGPTWPAPWSWLARALGLLLRVVGIALATVFEPVARRLGDG